MQLNINNVLRYLSCDLECENIELIEEIKRAEQDVKSLVDFKYNYKILTVFKGYEDVKFLNSNVTLKGNNIKEHLKDSSQVAIFIATLGHRIDKKIEFLEKRDKYRYLIYHAVASEIMENYCDIVNKEIINCAKEKKMNTLFRYSPGYGDLPLNTNKEILIALNGSKLGIYTTSACMFIPSKTVCAIIPFVKSESKDKSCKYCNIYDSCKKRLVGDFCEYKF